MAGRGQRVADDAGFAKPEIHAWCDQEGLAYTIGLITNARIEALAAAARTRQAAAARTKVCLLADTISQAGSWPMPRRIISKAEALTKGTTIRFVVTARTDPPEALYE